MASARLKNIVDADKLAFIKFRNDYMSAISYQKQINSAEKWGIFSGYSKADVANMRTQIKDFDAVELKKAVEIDDAQELDKFLEQKFKAEQAKKEIEKAKVAEDAKKNDVKMQAAPKKLSMFDQVVGFFSSSYLEDRKTEIKKTELDELKLRQEQRKRDQIKQKK